MKTYLSILLLAIVVPAMGAPVVIPQDTLDHFQESIAIHQNGSLDITITCSPLNGKTMDLPLEYASIENPVIESRGYQFEMDKAGVPQPVIEKRGCTFIRLIPDGNGTGVDSLVVVRFHVLDYFDWNKSKKAHDVVRFSKTFFNTSDFFIRNYQLEYRLPEGYLLHDILKTEPGFDPQKQPSPPFEVVKLDGHYMAVLTVQDLEAAARAMMNIEMLRAKRSMIPMMIGIVLSLLYLIFYRDVLVKERD